ncbi:MAG: hypothetical protein Q8P18_31870 [Pseudomonadota bacterium]|nr:hypothetical protein [Pseudomonadota bacterium]
MHPALFAALVLTPLVVWALVSHLRMNRLARRQANDHRKLP